MAVKDGRKATAKRRLASLRATRRRATLATGGHSVTLPLPDPYRPSGSGTGKPIKERDGDPINYRAPAHGRWSVMTLLARYSVCVLLRGMAASSAH